MNRLLKLPLIAVATIVGLWVMLKAADRVIFSSSAATGTFALGLFVIAGLGFYFLPAVVALGRKHKNRTSIFLVNLLLGWTLLFWVVALVWAFTASEAQQKQAA